MKIRNRLQVYSRQQAYRKHLSLKYEQFIETWELNDNVLLKQLYIGSMEDITLINIKDSDAVVVMKPCNEGGAKSISQIKYFNKLKDIYSIKIKRIIKTIQWG